MVWALCSSCASRLEPWSCKQSQGYCFPFYTQKNDLHKDVICLFWIFSVYYSFQLLSATLLWVTELLPLAHFPPAATAVLPWFLKINWVQLSPVAGKLVWWMSEYVGCTSKMEGGSWLRAVGSVRGQSSRQCKHSQTGEGWLDVALKGRATRWAPFSCCSAHLCFMRFYSQPKSSEPLTSGELINWSLKYKYHFGTHKWIMENNNGWITAEKKSDVR